LSCDLLLWQNAKSLTHLPIYPSTLSFPDLVTPTNNCMNLRQNFSWTLIGNVVYAACQWGMLVAIAKLGSPEMVGQFTFGLSITAPVFMFTNLHLRTVQVTDAKRQFLFGDYLSLRLIGTTIGVLAIGLIVIIIVTTAGSKYGYHSPEISLSIYTALAILCMAIAKAFESVSDICYGLIQQNDRMDRIARSMMVKGILSLILMGIGVYLSGGILWGTIGLAVAWGIVLICFDLPNASQFAIDSPLKKFTQNLALPKILANFKVDMPASRWDVQTLTKLAWLSLPLGLMMMLISLNLNVPRYFIQNYLGDKLLGIFGALSYLIIAGNIVINALCESASSRLAKYYATAERRNFGMLLVKLMTICGGFGIGGILLASIGGERVVTLLYRPEYAQYQEVFIWLMVAAGIGYVSSAVGYAVTAARYFRVQIPLFIVVTATSALGCLWLVPILGLKGAAIASVMAAVVQFLLNLGIIGHAMYSLK
jgi:O-antigen/teichoic acid export membrane protein